MTKCLLDPEEQKSHLQRGKEISKKEEKGGFARCRIIRERLRRRSLSFHFVLFSLILPPSSPPLHLHPPLKDTLSLTRRGDM